ncbi:hypothetical protein [Spirochaeta dissipatitropha]
MRYKYIIHIFFLAVILCGGFVSAADPVSGELDFSAAYVVPGGPRGFFVRNVQIDAVPSAIFIEERSEGRFVVREVYAEQDYLLPADSVWDFAAVYWEDDATIVIDGVLLEGRLVKGSFSLQDDDTILIQDLMESSRLDITRGHRAEGLLRLVLESEMSRQADEQLRLGEKIKEQENQLLLMKSRIEAAEHLELQYLEEIEQLVHRVSELEDENARLTEQVADLEYRLGSDGESAGAGAQYLLTEEIRQLRVEISQLRDELKDNRTEAVVPGPGSDVHALENELLGKLGSHGLVAMLQHRFTEEIHVQEGRAVFGDWVWDDSVLRQQDSSSLFARYRLPAPQNERPALYRLQGKSTGSGWVGYGIHLQAHSIRAAGYGHGESILVWLTRDRRAYGDDRTYLQLYRSFDDIDMRMQLHAAIETSIDDKLELAVMLEPVSGYITISVEGQDVLRYKLPFPVDSGSEIALRSLDTAEFHELEVRFVPDELLW